MHNISYDFLAVLLIVCVVDPKHGAAILETSLGGLTKSGSSHIMSSLVRARFVASLV